MRLVLLLGLLGVSSTLALPSTPAPENGRVVSIDSEKGWIPDDTGRPWTVLRTTPRTLSEWNGETWLAHPIPAGSEESGPPGSVPLTAPDIVADAEGRIWVMAYWHYKLHIFETHSGRWQTFPSIEAAFIALRASPPHFLGDGMFASTPQFSRDGRRVAYRSGVIDCCYYDGSSLRRFREPEIDGKMERVNNLGPPWFDKDDRLCVNIWKETSWRMDEAGHWSQLPFESHFPADLFSESQDRGQPLEPPDDCALKHYDHIVMDNLGAYWLLWQHELYRCVPGHCIKVFHGDEKDHFLVRSGISRVFVDASGDAVVESDSAEADGFIIKPRSAPPHASVLVESTAADAVRARFEVRSELPLEFRWCLDGGKWQRTNKDSIAIDGLPNGEHKLSCVALDADLQSQAVPTMATFTTMIDPIRQIAGLVSRLSDPDYEQRRSAVNALARQPDQATPALWKARETADEDQRWWIDATLQQIERNKQTATGNDRKSSSG